MKLRQKKNTPHLVLFSIFFYWYYYHFVFVFALFFTFYFATKIHHKLNIDQVHRSYINFPPKLSMATDVYI